jgi:hypothetical protein
MTCGCYFVLERYVEAVYFCGLSELAYPEVAYNAMLAGTEAYLLSGRCEEALRRFNNISSTHSEDYRPRFGTFYSNLCIGQQEEARNLLSSMEVDASLNIPFLMLAQAEYDIQDYEACSRYAISEVLANPDSPWAHFILAVCKGFRGIGVKSCDIMFWKVKPTFHGWASPGRRARTAT